LENGAYCFDTGLPVKETNELRQAIPIHFLKEALDWFENRNKMLENPPRRINIQGNALVFDDWSPVTEIQDVIDFFEPGPFREAAMIVFATNLAAEKAAKPGPMDIQAKDKRAEAARRNIAKANEARAAKRAAKVAASEAAPQAATG
jgi:hypothetical protein